MICVGCWIGGIGVVPRLGTVEVRAMAWGGLVRTGGRLGVVGGAVRVIGGVELFRNSARFCPQHMVGVSF